MTACLLHTSTNISTADQAMIYLLPMYVQTDQVLPVTHIKFTSLPHDHPD